MSDATALVRVDSQKQVPNVNIDDSIIRTLSDIMMLMYNPRVFSVLETGNMK